jgi:Flp pilus assembly protein TadB
MKEDKMILGLILIFAGILIAIYPPLLSLIVALILIFWGISILYISHYYKKISRKFGDPYLDFFFRI